MKSLKFVIFVSREQKLVYKRNQFPGTQLPWIGMLALASEVFNAILETQPDSANYKSLLTYLEWGIMELPVVESFSFTGRLEESSSNHMIPKEARTLELFQLSLLIYLERASNASLVRPSPWTLGPPEPLQFLSNSKQLNDKLVS